MVKHLDYNGISIPYSIGYYALKRFKRDTGVQFEDTPDDDLEALELIAWYAIEAGCKIEKIPVPLLREDMEMFLNECMVQFNESIGDFFQTPPPPEKIRPTGGRVSKPRKASSRSKSQTSKK